MRRRITAVLIFALLGVTLNVMVAWGCALWASNGNLPDVPFHDPQMLDRVVGLPADMPLATRSDAGPAVTTYTIQWHRPGQSNAVLMLDAGWPLPSLYGQVDIGGTTHNGFPAPRWLRPGRIMTMARPIPLRPLARGFVINSLAGAVVLWIVVMGPRLALRRWRIRKDRCPACGYDLRGVDHDRCPECGGRTKSPPKAA